MAGLDFILLWVLFSCCTFLGVSQSLRTMDNHPIIDWDFAGWAFVIFLSVIFPLGILVLLLVHDLWIRKVLLKERDWKPLEGKKE